MPWGQQLLGRLGGKRAVLRGDHIISRKAIAQGMSDALRCPVCSCAHFLLPLHMRPRVQRAPGIPCALWIGEGEDFPANLGQIVPRKCETVSSVIASEAKQSMPQRADIWVASRSLSSGAHSRDPLARN